MDACRRDTNHYKYRIAKYQVIQPHYKLFIAWALVLYNIKPLYDPMTNLEVENASNLILCQVIHLIWKLDNV